MTIIKLPSILKFEWDEGNKNKNWVKHRVRGKEAEEAFFDKRYLVLEDNKHSEHENRYILFGRSEKERLLFVVYTLRDLKVRIISARDINRKEVLFYEKAITITKV